MDGITLQPLKQISNSKGDIFHALKKSDQSFCEFGEAYFTNIYFGQIKGWKKHTEMVLNLVVPIGDIEFTIYDDREKSTTKGQFFNVTLSQGNYQRLTVEPGLWMAFKGQSKDMNLLLNIANIEHDPNESENRDLEAISYAW